jgi:hypothetical protein
VTTIADARAASTPQYSAVCIPGMVTVMASNYGDPKPDGGTQYAGRYYMADSTGAVIQVYKSKNIGALGTDPARGDKVDVVGKVELFPSDGGSNATVEISGSTIGFTAQGQGTIPTPQAATLAQLAPSGADDSMVGQYVTVPAGTYTQDNAAPEFTKAPYQDGLKLTDGSGNSMLVDIFTFSHTTGNCLLADGGFPDLTAGGFNAVFDHEKADDGNIYKVLLYGHCGQ